MKCEERKWRRVPRPCWQPHPPRSTCDRGGARLLWEGVSEPEPKTGENHWRSCCVHKLSAQAPPPTLRIILLHIARRILKCNASNLRFAIKGFLVPEHQTQATHEPGRKHHQHRENQSASKLQTLLHWKMDGLDTGWGQGRGLPQEGPASPIEREDQDGERKAAALPHCYSPSFHSSPPA